MDEIYLSLFVFISLGSLSIGCLDDLYRYLFLFAGVYITAISFFFFYPTYIQRPQTNETSFWYGLLISKDLPINNFPSLHASFCITTTFTLFKNINSFFYKNIYRSLICFWSGLILLSILKLKRHYFLM